MDLERAAQRAAATARRMSDEKERKRAVLARLVAEARPVLAARGEAGAQSLAYPTIFEPPSDGWRPGELFPGR